MNIRFPQVALAGALALTTGCAVGPRHVAPVAPLPAQGGFLGASEAGIASAPVPDDWWRLFDDPALACQLRYFEMDAGGHSTLERHEHAHAVMILRGHGHCLVGGEVRAIGPQDLVSIPAWAWHQFRATRGEAFGFLCMVNHLRDRPQIPTEDELAALRTDPTIRAFLDDAPLA